MKIFIVTCVIILVLATTLHKIFPLAKPVGKRMIKSMKIESSAFANNAYMPRTYSCDGESINPPLVLSDIPANTQSLVLIVDDPDAPMGTFVHWVVYNIPPTIREIKEHSAIPGAINGINTTGKPGYTPACPPSGTHRYFFKLYALDTLLQIGNNADKQKIEQAMQNHILAQAELIGLYKRN